MKINVKFLSKKAVKTTAPSAIVELSDESLNQVIGGVSFSESIIECCCCYKYGSQTEMLSSSLSE